MSEWEKHTKGRMFISDLGQSMAAPGLKMSRYAVWKPNEEGEKHQIVEVSADINYLKRKYHLENSDILKVVKKII